MKAIFDQPQINGNICKRINSGDPVDGEYALAISLHDLTAKDVGILAEAYADVNGHFVARSAEDVQAVIDAKVSSVLAGLTRAEDIQKAQDAGELKQYTVEQAQQWITGKINGASTVAGVKQAVLEVLLRMVPYILPK